MKDSFYTPTFLAKRLVDRVSKLHVNTVSDFAIGDGELLRAALKRWPTAKYYGTDISHGALTAVRNKHPEWILGKCDFLNPKSRSKCKSLKNLDESIDLILLNPPFSCVGGSRHKLFLDGIQYEMSKAMAFVITALKYLSKDGCLFAVLPNSVAYSQKDQKIWLKLKRDYNLQLIEETDNHHFTNCSSKVILVSIQHEKSNLGLENQKSFPFYIGGIKIFRGKVGMHKVVNNSRAKYFLVHSTHLQSNRLRGLNTKIINRNSRVTGPALLIPRVGNPSLKKICIIRKNETYILSDCVIAILANSLKDISFLRKCLALHWNDLEQLYKGTGAKYVTVDKIENYFNIKRSMIISHQAENSRFNTLSTAAV